MTPKSEKEAPQQPKVSFREAPDFKSIYVNWIQTATSQLEIVMIVAEMHPLGPEMHPLGPGGIEVEQKARVMMHPLQAKIVVEMLQNAIRSYEENYGEIKIPGGILAQVEVQPKKA